MARKKNTPEAATAASTPSEATQADISKATREKLYDFSEARRPFGKYSPAKLRALLKKGVFELERIEGLLKLQRLGIDGAYANLLQTHVRALFTYKQEIVGELLTRRVSARKIKSFCPRAFDEEKTPD